MFLKTQKIFIQQLNVLTIAPLKYESLKIYWLVVC